MPSIACTPSVPAPGDATALRERARGAMLGLAVGDALGAPAENMKPSEIRARWGRITGYVAEHPSGTDDTWRDACRTLSGCALPRLTGTDLVHLAELLAATELATPGG